MSNDIYQFSAKDIRGHEIKMSEFSGKTLLIVNTASHCGFTPQYKGLQELYQNNESKGLVVLGFPCNQFGAQEPGAENEISSFCETNYNISFPMFSKVDVNGANAHPIYKFLKKEAPGLLGTEGIKWNFTKFLVDKSGHVIKRYSPTDTPQDIEKEVNLLLQQAN